MDNEKEEEVTHQKMVGTSLIQSTDLTLVENNFNTTHNYQVVDRNTGKPIVNAQIQLQNKKTKYYPYINKKLITDVNGYASYTANDYYRNVKATVKFKEDIATFGNFYLKQKQFLPLSIVIQHNNASAMPIF